MKKTIAVKKFIVASLLIFAVSASLIAFVLAPAREAFALTYPKPLKTVAVQYKSELGTASLYGMGRNYITDVKVTVSFPERPPYDIPLEDGYSPFMDVFDFGAEEKLLFCSSQTGGSGGYGNYRVYFLKTDSYDLVYDDKIDRKNSAFGASFQPNGFMRLTDNKTQNGITVYVGNMDEFFYDKIFAPDGSVIGEAPDVNAVSFVSPSLNPASGIWRLVSYRSVSAVAQVNRLGYVVQTLDYVGGSFKPSFTEFSVSF